MKTLTREEYDFMLARHLCKGGTHGTPNQTFISSMDRVLSSLIERGLMYYYQCPDDKTHGLPSALGKEAMMCYEFAHKVMDLALT